MNIINSVTGFLNNNPVIGIILILVFIIILMIIYNNRCRREGFEEVQSENKAIRQECDCSGINNITDKAFHDDFVGKNKIVNFKCELDNHEYYLVNVTKAECLGSSEENECYQNILMLMDVSDVESNLKTYTSDLEKNRKVCNLKAELDCDQNKSGSEECKREYPHCVSDRMYIHDFTVIEQLNDQKDKPRQYIIKGVAKPSLPGDVSVPAMLTKNIYDAFGIPTVCSDSGAYETAKISVVEKQIDNKGGIIGGLNSHINVKLYFESKDQKKVYLSACKDKTCMYNGKKYMRVCLTEDHMDPTVLILEPFIVKA